MKLIIAGGRDFTNKFYMVGCLDSISTGITEVVSGGAMGADTLGERWARDNELPVTHFLPQWAAYGKSAGHLRNKEMAEYADAVALFPGGKGTASMFKEAEKTDLIIHDFRGHSND